MRGHSAIFPNVARSGPAQAGLLVGLAQLAVKVRLARLLARVGPWLLLVALSGTPALAEAPREFQIKAVLLLRFAQFTEWPSNAFERADSPLVIGVLGENPFGDALKLALAGESAHGHPMVDRSIRDLREARRCHVLYISESKREEVARIVAGLDHLSILTVGSLEGFAKRDGGMVRFVMEQGKVKIRVNLEAMSAAHLVIDARVLRAVQVIEGK